MTQNDIERVTSTFEKIKICQFAPCLMEISWIFAEDLGFEETLLYDKGPLTLLTKHLRHIVSHNPKAKHRWFRQLFVANGIMTL